MASDYDKNDFEEFLDRLNENQEKRVAYTTFHGVYEVFILSDSGYLESCRMSGEDCERLRKALSDKKQ